MDLITVSRLSLRSLFFLFVPLSHPCLCFDSQVWSLFGSLPLRDGSFHFVKCYRSRGLGTCRYNFSSYWLSKPLPCSQPDCHHLKNQVPSIPELLWSSSVQSDTIPTTAFCLHTLWFGNYTFNLIQDEVCISVFLHVLGVIFKRRKLTYLHYYLILLS